jgi:hypothetical protein
MDVEIYTKQLNEITVIFESVSRSAKYEDLSDQPIQVLANIMSRSKAAVARIAGTSSEYYRDIEKVMNVQSGRFADANYKIREVIGAVYALRDDLQRGYLKSVQDIIQSEVFSNYIEMADHLLSQGYKDASAIIVGTTLEAHLKELAKANSIDVESNGKAKKASTLNDELAKSNVYSSAYQKQITAWLGLRNEAAHGNFSIYSNDQVKLMLEGVRLFTTK